MFLKKSIFTKYQVKYTRNKSSPIRSKEDLPYYLRSRNKVGKMGLSDQKTKLPVGNLGVYLIITYLYNFVKRYLKNIPENIEIFCVGSQNTLNPLLMDNNIYIFIYKYTELRHFYRCY